MAGHLYGWWKKSQLHCIGKTIQSWIFHTAIYLSMFRLLFSLCWHPCCFSHCATVHVRFIYCMLIPIEHIFFLSLRHLTWLLHWTHSQNELIFFEASVREKSRKNTRYKIYAKAFAVSDLRNRLSNREIKAKRKIYSAAKRNIRCSYVCVDMCSFILLNYSSSCKYT